MTARRVLFVCLGNICRSPSAEGVARSMAEREGLAHAFDFDSAGSGGWHAGDPPDPRAIRACARRGVDISGLRARQSTQQDFEVFDLILAMDRSNAAHLERARSGRATPIQLLLDYAPERREREVPDPYYGGEDGFEEMLDLIEAGTAGLLRRAAS